ncbi:MAG: S9 family peptidase [Bacteroidales bacterium]|jgi:dipeptidyl-peptidase-4|nr:S9 family peptidase [Bacteroidales bacterium]
MKERKVIFSSLFGLLFSLTSIYGQQKEIKLTDIWQDYIFRPKGVPGFATMESGDFYTVTTVASIDKHRFDNGEKTSTLLTQEQLSSTGNKLKIRDISDYSFDKMEQKILIATQMEAIYRRSSKAFYYVYDIQAKTLTPLSDTSKGKQSFATFSPDGSKVAFVRDNNLFYKDLTTSTEYQITHDGKQGMVINGMADWVYEEELSMSQCFYWSPDNSQIAYLRFDESKVKEFTLSYYEDLYPRLYTYKYPKAGEDNSAVSLCVYNLKGSVRKTLVWTGKDNYIPRMYWLNNGTDILVLLLNRTQNKIEFYRYNALSGSKELVYTDQNKYWLDITDDYFICTDNNSMIVSSERDGFNHIYHVIFGGAVTQLTTGKWEVADIVAVDMSKKMIYYLSNESNVLNRDLYCIDFQGKNKKMLSSGKGWNDVEFSPTCKFYRNTYSDANTPPIYTINTSKGVVIKTLETNEEFKQIMKYYGFVNKEFFDIKTDAGVQMNAWILKPSNFDATKKYPVLMFVYGGPGSQQVSNSFSGIYDLSWYQMLTQKGYIVACFDGRGCATKGDEFKKCIYKQMGKLEAIDQIAAANYLKTLPYIDGNRIGIWGWSFGGYLSSLALFTGGNTFKMAMAVAPVTSWRYYDNIYTERFLEMPQHNASGYDDNSPITHADKLNGAYLLVHGLADDNVHFQNAAELILALNKAGKQYEQCFYPNKNHGIYGGNTRLHLYTKLTDFILKNL